MKKLLSPLMVLLTAFCITVSVNAQAPGSQDTGDRDRNRPMMGNPEQMRQMMAERLKGLLEFNDDEWSVIGPKVTKVLDLSMESRGNPGMMLMGRPGTPPGGNTGRRGRVAMPDSPVAKAMEELQTLLAKKDVSSEDIKAQIVKLRKAKDKAKQEMSSAQKELRELLSVKQEATLIAMGVLE